jgi:hypothetical protein
MINRRGIPNSNHIFINYMNESTTHKLIKFADDTELRVGSSLIRQPSPETMCCRRHWHPRVGSPLGLWWWTRATDLIFFSLSFPICKMLLIILVLTRLLGCWNVDSLKFGECWMNISSLSPPEKDPYRMNWIKSKEIKWTRNKPRVLNLDSKIKQNENRVRKNNSVTNSY